MKINNICKSCIYYSIKDCKGTDKHFTGCIYYKKDNLMNAIIVAQSLEARSEKRKAEALKKIADTPIDYTAINEAIENLMAACIAEKNKVLATRDELNR